MSKPIDWSKPIRIKGKPSVELILLNTNYNSLSRPQAKFLVLCKSLWEVGSDAVLLFDEDGLGASFDVENIPETVISYRNTYVSYKWTPPRIYSTNYISASEAEAVAKLTSDKKYIEVATKVEIEV